MKYWIAFFINLFVFIGLQAQNTIEEAIHLHEQALELSNNGQDEEAFNLVIKALCILDTIDQKETSLYAECLHDAGMFAIMGEKDLDTFTHYIKNSINLKKKLYGNSEDYYWSVQCYADGLLYYSENSGFPTNISSLEEAIESYETIPSYQTLPSYYNALNYLAQLYENIDISKSISYGSKIVHLVRLNKFNCDSITYISNLGNYYKEDEQYDKALYYLNIALKYREEANIKNDKLRISYERMASLYARIGEYDKACSFEEKAKGVEELINGMGSSSYATILMNYGCYLYANNDFERGLEFLQKAYFHSKSNKSNVAFNLANIYSRRNADSCYVYLKEFWDSTKIQLDNNMIRMPEVDRFHYITNGQTYYTLYAPLLHSRTNPDHEGLLRLAFDGVLYHKSRLFRNLEGQKIDDAIDEFHFDDIRRSLNENEIAVEMFYNPFVNIYGGDTFYVFIVKNNWKAPKCVYLDANEINIALNGEAPTTSSYFPLYETIWKRILSASEINDNDRVYISCDGVLSKIPIEWICNYENEYMGDKYDIVRVTSTINIPQLNNRKRVNSVALYGGLDYQKKPKEQTGNLHDSGECPLWGYLHNLLGDSIVSNYRSSVEYLPWTLIEVDSIYNILNDYLQPGTISLMNDDNGTEDSFNSMTGCSPSIIHIATHGFFIDAREYMDWYDYYKFCLENTGLLLSGSLFYKDDSNISASNDGILRSSEIAELDLGSTDLVVLSACKTGLTGLAPYGLIGLQRAFKVAGAKTIIMSLENVDDAATCYLMTTFYRNLMNGMSKREAFKEAQWALRTNESFKSFNYWAWFIMID